MIDLLTAMSRPLEVRLFEGFNAGDDDAECQWARRRHKRPFAVKRADVGTSKECADGYASLRQDIRAALSAFRSSST